MTATTPEEKRTPPDLLWAQHICRKGQRSLCCRFLVAGPNGFSCQKHGIHSPLLTARAAKGQMVAISNNCEGRAI